MSKAGSRAGVANAFRGPSKVVQLCYPYTISSQSNEIGHVDRVAIGVALDVSDFHSTGRGIEVAQVAGIRDWRVQVWVIGFSSIRLAVER